MTPDDLLDGILTNMGRHDLTLEAVANLYQAVPDYMNASVHDLAFEYACTRIAEILDGSGDRDAIAKSIEEHGAQTLAPIATGPAEKLQPEQVILLGALLGLALTWQFCTSIGEGPYRKNLELVAEFTTG